MKVRRYTVVARSFQGLPRKHFPSVTVVAFASGDYKKRLPNQSWDDRGGLWDGVRE